MGDKEQPDRRRLTLLVVTLGVGLLVLGVVLLGLVAERPVDLPLRVSPWFAILGFLVAGLAPLMLEVQGSTFSLSITEVPIVVGMLSMQRVPLAVAGTIGWTAALLLTGRRAPLKLTLNVPLMFCEVAVASALFDTIVEVPRTTSPVTWLGLLVGLAASIVLSTTVVSGVIRAAGDRVTLTDGLRNAGLGLVNSTMSLALTLVAIVSLRATPWLLLPLAVLASVSIVPIRRQAKLQRRYDGLLTLHEFTAGLTSSTDLSLTLGSVLAETAKVLRADDAVIVLPRNGTVGRSSGPDVVDEPGTEQAVDESGDRGVALGLRSEAPELPRPGDALWTEVMAGRSVCLPRGSSELGGYLASTGLRDLMAVPLVHGEAVIGALVALDRLGDTSTFDADDLAIFATMANQTTVTLENLRLIDRLRDESAERRHQALHDELTGLPNRAHLYATLDQRLPEGDLAVAILDLNRFKEVNDTLGHHAGDEVLVATAQRLRRAVPSSAFVARLGGDEFAIVLFGVTTAGEAVSRLAAVELVFAQPIQLDAMSLRVDASVGFVLSRDHGTDRGTLLRRADVAMYAAKQVRGTTIRAYERTQERTSRRSLEVVAALRSAIDSDRIEVAFQPQARFGDGAVIGVEALARWSDPALGEIRPDEFIPLAEQSGLVRPLTDVVLRRSLDACASWRARGRPLGVAVNIDAATLVSDGFVESVLDAIRRRSLPADALTLEMTERELVRELDVATGAVQALRNVGVRFSIDDFGTGYSSMSYLAKLPIDEVKIDRSFVTGISTSPQRRVIVGAIADIAHAYALTTVVEGIEDQETWDTAAGLGCDLGQGFHLARPMFPDAFLTWLAAGALR